MTESGEGEDARADKTGLKGDLLSPCPIAVQTRELLEQPSDCALIGLKGVVSRMRT